MPELSPQPDGSPRKSVLLIVTITGLLAVGAIIAYKNSGRDHPPAAETMSASGPDRDRATGGTTAAQPATPPADAPVVTTPRPPAVAPAAAPVVLDPSSSGYPSQLVNWLGQVDLSKGEVTAEQAAGFKQGLQALVERGAESVPAIRDYLAKNVDVALGSVKGGEQLGASSLRLAFIDALATIGGPEAIALSAQTLQNTYDPKEIAALAKNLEAQAPEQYRQMAVDAARAALSAGAAGKLEGRDAGPLFNVLVQYGGAAVINDLQDAKGQWRYYSAIALGSLPNNAGVPALIEMADPKGPATGSRNVALQMLAQASAQSPEASAALLEQARMGQISSAGWISIGPLLEGNTLRIGAPGEGHPGPKYHLAMGPQDFYSEPGGPLSPDDVKQRLLLIDALLSATSNETAVTALNRAKAGLQQAIRPQ